MNAKWLAAGLVVLALAFAGIFIWKRPVAGAADAAPKPPETNGIVAFRMEQQWLIHMKLALAEEAQLPQQIHSTGRLIADPSKRALVAPLLCP